MVKNEAGILLPGGKIHRPDKVILNESKIILLDYKTTDFENIPENLLKKYFQQLKNYSDILENMYLKEVEAYLLILGYTVRILKLNDF